MSRRSVAVALLVVSATCLIKGFQLRDQQAAQSELTACTVGSASPVIITGGPSGFELAGFTVTSAVDPLCAGKTAHLQVRQNDQLVTDGAGPLTTGGRVMLTSPVPANQVDGYRFFVG